MIDTSALNIQSSKQTSQSRTDGAIHQARAFGESAQNEQFELISPLSLTQPSANAPVELGTPVEEPSADISADQETLLSTGFASSQQQEKESLIGFQSLANGQQPSAKFTEPSAVSQLNVSLANRSTNAQPLRQADSGLLNVAATNGHTFETLSTQTANPSLVNSTAANAQLNQATTAAVSTAVPQSATTEWAAVKIDTNAAKWGEQMMQVLHDRVSVQAQQNLQEAKIRLDPPELGKLDLLVRVEGDRLNVQINANASATREALMQVSERLRVELQNQHFVHVEVNVGTSDSQQGHASHPHQQSDQVITASQFANSGDGEAVNSSNQSEHWLNTLA